MRESPSPTQERDAPAAITRWRRRVARARPLAIFGAMALTALLVLLAHETLFPPPEPLSRRQLDGRIGEVMASATVPPANSSLVYQVILPSLVYIQREGTGPDGEEGFGLGSGVVVNQEGDILTALHVVEGAVSIEVLFADGTESRAEIVNAVPENDIAVLRPARPPELIVPAILGNAGTVRVGDVTYAVGNPLGLAGSMSAGVISGLNRSFTVNGTERRLEGLIQFDAAVNPGNSGGPLLNRAGQVVGIVTALANPNEQDVFTGIGFAVPIGTAADAAGAPSY